jgi:hypothetical protein
MGVNGQGSWTWEGALCGVVPPVILPLDEAGRVDEPAIALLVEPVLSGGSSGLFILGGCGEGAWLTRDSARAGRASHGPVGGWPSARPGRGDAAGDRTGRRGGAPGGR